MHACSRFHHSCSVITMKSLLFFLGFFVVLETASALSIFGWHFGHEKCRFFECCSKYTGTCFQVSKPGCRHECYFRDPLFPQYCSKDKHYAEHEHEYEYEYEGRFWPNVHEEYEEYEEYEDEIYPRIEDGDWDAPPLPQTPTQGPPESLCGMFTLFDSKSQTCVADLDAIALKSNDGKFPMMCAKGKVVNTNTPAPTRRPTEMPTRFPTNYPSKSPTAYPTRQPTSFPTKYPTNFPTRKPTRKPTNFPTNKPTRMPTNFPTKKPTKAPTQFPTKRPSTAYPSRMPTTFPTQKQVNCRKYRSKQKCRRRKHACKWVSGKLRGKFCLSLSLADEEPTNQPTNQPQTACSSLKSKTACAKYGQSGCVWFNRECVFLKGAAAAAAKP